MLRFLALAALAVVCLNTYSQPMRHKGYPSRDGSIDLRSNFANPPKGYGDVPFYWWSGDSLKFERLMDELSLLSDAPVDGLSVSYIHTHPSVDKEINANGYGSFGKADAGIPGFQTEDWWSLWNRFSAECVRRNIGLGLDDYVVGWPNNGYYVDDVLQSDEIKNYQGRLNYTAHPVKAGEEIDISLPENVVSAVAYPGKINLMKYISEGHLSWKSSLNTQATIYIIHTTPSPELHPQYGNRLVDAYFNKFENKLDAEGRLGLNYFFQDELQYNLNIYSWSEDMQKEFMARKGYDVLPYLPALWTDIGDITPKVRLDYAQVLTELAEERYFKPIFEWHNSRGLIYGCDNNGRGMEPLQYLDYFRATSWHTAPGNDAPARGSSFRQTKVSSSITHLYKRPRTWLEAFHSMGWDSNGEWMTSQLDHHMIAGGNLLCMHGLYYSTHGGWWEWAPPSFHFRMPYWPHMKKWLKYAERMCFVLSQGVHVADIAVLYPTESMMAYPEARADSLWKVTDTLSNSGLDYDFIDYQSLQNATVEDGLLHISDENYRVLVLADIKALHKETMDKIYDFHKQGGIVIALGELPLATTRVGAHDAKLDAQLKEMFPEGSMFHVSSSARIPELIASLFTPDFKTQSHLGKVLHRRIGQQDVYMVMGVNKGDSVFLRAKGRLESWDAMHGTIADKPILAQNEQGTWIRWDAENNESRLLVFTPGMPVMEDNLKPVPQLAETLPLDGEWDIEIVPTMNNKWGDFRLPASDEIIGPEAREIRYQFIDKGKRPNVNAQTRLQTAGIYGYAPYMETINLDAKTNLKEAVADGLSEEEWTPYCFSWQYGVFDSPGSQGYHGLKGKVDNRFIILDQGCHQIFRTKVYAPADGQYRIEQEGVMPDVATMDGQLISGTTISLTKGWHEMIIAYANTPKESYRLTDLRGNTVDNRQRSAVVIYPQDSPSVKDYNPYGDIIAMKWFQTDHLIYSTQNSPHGTWLCQFETVPGTSKMSLCLAGTLNKIWVDGKSLGLKQVTSKGNGRYDISLNAVHQSGVSLVTVQVEPIMGAIGPAIFLEPVKMTSRGGKMPLGNWSEQGSLKYYSGGIIYTKDFILDADPTGEISLSLGKVNATCEVKINGETVDVLLGPPYTLDVTRFLKKGRNKIEVLVYSSLANHYQTIPSPYRGEPISGLFGPVELRIFE
jgi:hypothetical protein